MRTQTLALFAAAVLSVSLFGCASTKDEPVAASMTLMNGAVPDDSAQAHPLAVGQRAPSAMLRNVDGSSFDLAKAYRNGPVMLIFYRGGWCPYCNTHLAELVKVDQPLADMGVTLLAVSPDQPSKLRETEEKNGLNYALLSDSDVTLARAFGLAFRVDDATIERYHGYGIDLDAASGHPHHILPVPAVYLIDKQGVIRFAHSNPDYKHRLSAEEVLAAAKKLTGK